MCVYDYDELSLPASNTHFSDHPDDTGTDSYNLYSKDKEGLTVGRRVLLPEGGGCIPQISLTGQARRQTDVQLSSEDL